jgi:hypothetical protein
MKFTTNINLGPTHKSLSTSARLAFIHTAYSSWTTLKTKETIFFESSTYVPTYMASYSKTLESSAPP